MVMPFVSCLCPTYRRPELLANAVACFLAQDYPPDRRELVILDDAGQFKSQAGNGWELLSLPRRFQSLPEKYNAIAGLAKGDIFVVWEDDDIYLPEHLSQHVAALSQGDFSKPSRIFSLYTGELREENAGGLFHGTIAFTRKLFEAAGGWPLTRRGDFDQQWMSRLSANGILIDTCQFHSPTYVFRWASTGAYHGQSAMQGAQDQEWYDRCKADGDGPSCVDFVPRFDSETARIIASQSWTVSAKCEGQTITTVKNLERGIQSSPIPGLSGTPKSDSLLAPIRVYITCYNVLSWPRNLAQQCQDLGFIPVLIDNASTYPPLLAWYETCPYEVMRLEKNYGCYGFWQLPVSRLQTGYYIVTDCDLDLSGVPCDLASRMIEVFERHTEVTKVGLSLEIDDLPDAFLLKDSVRTHESQFWRRQVEPGVWEADIGATFALYHHARDPGRNFYRGLRLDRPYTARHLPWYLHRENATDEHRYYFDRIEAITHWSVRMKDLLNPVLPEDQFTRPCSECPHPEHWTATDAENSERELCDFVYGWVRMQQPECCLVIAPGLGEISRAIGRALRENGHGQQFVLSQSESERASNRLLCHQTPTYVIDENPAEYHPLHNFQFVWFGSASFIETQGGFERLIEYCNGFIVFHGSFAGGRTRTMLKEYEHINHLRVIDVPTPRGLALAESRLIRPQQKMLGEWHDLAGTGGGGGREDLQHGWHNLAADLFPAHDVIDVGAGLGESRARLSRTALRVRLQDPGPGLPVDFNCFVTELPDGEATVVTAFDVIEHIEQDEEFLRELLRIARVHVFLTTPNWFVSRARNRCHIREYTPAQLESLCKVARADLRYWAGDSVGEAAKEISRQEFLISREPHLGILLTHNVKSLGLSARIQLRPQLTELYERAITVPSDINEHCQRLKELSSQCRHVTEFGMRPMASTVALLAGQPEVLVSYHQLRYPQIELYESLARPSLFRFIEGDSVSVEIDPTDLLFLDTHHTAERLSQELILHAQKVRQWIVLHDTVIFGERGEDGGPGLKFAVRQFLQEHHDWKIEEEYQHQYGLMILRRRAVH